MKDAAFQGALDSFFKKLDDSGLVTVSPGPQPVQDPKPSTGVSVSEGTPPLEKKPTPASEKPPSSENAQSQGPGTVPSNTSPQPPVPVPVPVGSKRVDLNELKEPHCQAYMLLAEDGKAGTLHVMSKADKNKRLPKGSVLGKWLQGTMQRGTALPENSLEYTLKPTSLVWSENHGLVTLKECTHSCIFV